MMHAPRQSQLPGVPPPARLPFFSSVALSSQRKGWGTPLALFDALCRRAAGLPPEAPVEIIPRPWVDPCASPDNALLPRYFSPEEDGLAQSWAPPAGPRGPLVLPDYVFFNPPYGEPEEACSSTRCQKLRCQQRGHHLETRLPGIEDWTAKALQEALAWGLCVEGLLPHRAASWWRAMLEPPAAAGAFLGGVALPGKRSPLHRYWPTLEWRLYRWEALEVEVALLDGRLPFRPEPGSTKATTGQPQTGKERAAFDSAVVRFRGLRPVAREAT